jgi:hypothetical protein
MIAAVRDRWGDRRDQPGERAPQRLGTLRAGHAPAGVAEAVVDKERLAAQFLGDLDALDRLEALASQFACVDHSCRAALVHAEVASTVHRFADARDHLARAAVMGGPVRPSSATC